MCGIAGIVEFNNLDEKLQSKLEVMGNILAHRGPDDKGIWIHENLNIGFTHRRLSIIDLSMAGKQPMSDNGGNWIIFNGEIYNYKQIGLELNVNQFKSKSDTEIILLAYRKWGRKCLNKFRGMFAFVIWDEDKKELFCARDHFGIKPFYYFTYGEKFYFASEIKALLPFKPEIKTNKEGFKDYLTFQLCLNGKTLFEGIEELKPASFLTFSKNKLRIQTYWEVFYEPDFSKSEKYFQKKFTELLTNSVQAHMVGDVPVGAYISGGYDSSSIGSIANSFSNGNFIGFTGKFSKHGEQFDESIYASLVANQNNFELKSIDISSNDFIDNISKVIYHLDHPVAGPGSFSQYMVSKLASKYMKVVVGGQGGDEIFGGYARYVISYLEQCLKAAIDGTYKDGNFVVTIESIELVDDVMNILQSEYGDELTIQTASEQEGDDIAQSIDTIGGNADLGAMAALFASMLVVGFIMVIITKERVNEIGVLKAIGLPNTKIVTQFLSESIFMASLGFLVCIVITLVAGPMMQTMLIESGSDDSSSSEQGSSPQFSPGQILNPTPESSSMDSITSLEFSVDAKSIATSLGLTILIGVIGALYPIMGALKMQPAQALRYE